MNKVRKKIIITAVFACLLLSVAVYVFTVPKVYADFERVEKDWYTLREGGISYPQVHFRYKGDEYNQKLNEAIRKYTVDWLSPETWEGVIYWVFPGASGTQSSIDVGLYIFNDKYLVIKYTWGNPEAQHGFDSTVCLHYVIDMDTDELVLLDDLIDINERTAELFIENMSPVDYSVLDSTPEEAYDWYMEQLKQTFTKEIMLQELQENTVTYEEFLKEGGNIYHKNGFYLNEDGICLDYEGLSYFPVYVLIPYDTIEQVLIDEDFKNCLKEKNSYREIECKG